MAHPVAVKRVWIAIVVFCVALAGVIGWQVVQPGDQPVYEGKTLTSWLTGVTEGGTAGYMKAEEAVRQVGTNAIPTLLRLLWASDSALKVKVVGLLERQHVVKLGFTSAETWNIAGRLGFKMLGTNAASAVPALIQIARQGTSPFSQASAIESLGAIGPAAKEAVSYLITLATNQSSGLDFSASWAVVQIDPEAAARARIRVDNDLLRGIP